MGLFGSVQVVGILCSIVRNKLVALWIGPAGVGLFGLFNQALEMMATATNLGVRTSSVRDISQTMKSGDATALARIIVVVRRWSLWLGLAGALLMLALAPWLSRVTFGNEDYQWGFVALSTAVLLMALTNGEQAVLQGLARLKRLAHVGLWGSLGGLLVSVPLFYWLRERSIVPSIIAYAACAALAAWLLRDRDHKAVPVSAATTVAMGTGFVRLGIFMTLGSFVGLLADYVFRAWLTHVSIAEVGLYNAGVTLFTKYTGLVFTALGMEFFPRLAAVVHSKLRVCAYVGQEIMLALTVLAPVLSLFIVLRDPIVALLYSEEFAGIATFVSWGMVGIIFKAVSWCMAFVIVARGSGMIFLAVEGFDALVGITLNITFYQLWGLDGLGASFVAWYIVYAVIVAVVYYGHYRLRLPAAVAGHVLWTALAVGLVMWLMELGLAWLAAAVTAVVLLISLLLLRRLWR